MPLEQGLTIKNDRWSKKFGKTSLTKEQKEFIKKLERASVIAYDNGRQDLSSAAGAVLEFLPEHPVLATVFAEIYGLTGEVIEELRELFNVAKTGDHN